MQSHRQHSKRRTVIWQAATLALLAGGVGLAALPQVRGALAPKAPPERKVEAAAPPAPPAQPPLATATAADVLSRVTSWRPAPPPPPVEPEAAPVVVAPPPPPTEWVYIGSIITPSLRSALVRVDNAQQIVRVGSTYNETKLITVEPEYIEIEKDAIRERIALADRTLLAPTDAPKRPVAFKSGPAPAAGNQAAAAMAMTRPQGPGSVSPVAAPPTQPMTFDQARAAALAAREAMAKGMGGSLTLPSDHGGKDDGAREMAIKMLADDVAKPEDRMKMLQTLGVTPGMPMETAQDVMRKYGIQPNDATREALEAIANMEAQKESK